MCPSCSRSRPGRWPGAPPVPVKGCPATWVERWLDKFWRILPGAPPCPKYDPRAKRCWAVREIAPTDGEQTALFGGVRP